MTTTRRINALTAVAIAAAAVAAVPGAASAAPAKTQLREVCAFTYVTKTPDRIPVGSVQKGEKLELGRRSPSGKWAYTVVRRPKFTTRGWVKVAALCEKGQRAEFMKTSRYSVSITNSRAGGDPGFLYVGGPANITVRDKERAGQPVKVCITPAPIERSSCRTGRTGQTIDTIVWSAAAPTEVRVAIEGGPVLSEKVYPYAVPVREARR